MDASAFRVGFADVDGVADPTAYPYNRLSLENLSQLAQVLIRSTFDLVVVDGVEYLATDNYRGGNSPVAERARQIESIFTRVPMPNLALVFTWQVNRASLGLSFNYSIPSALAHRASLILQVENKGQRVRVTKNRFGEPDGVAEFGPRWREILREPPEPEFDRSLIKTRFEREDVI
jgi:predicted ATP-dependent serine protease